MSCLSISSLFISNPSLFFLLVPALWDLWLVMIKHERRLEIINAVRDKSRAVG